MLKIRIEGLPEEIEEAEKLMPLIFRVLNESKAYPNTGRSVYYRKYVDVELRKKKAEEDFYS